MNEEVSFAAADEAPNQVIQNSRIPSNLTIPSMIRVGGHKLRGWKSGGRRGPRERERDPHTGTCM